MISYNDFDILSIPYTSLGGGKPTSTYQYYCFIVVNALSTTKKATSATSTKMQGKYHNAWILLIKFNNLTRIKFHLNNYDSEQLNFENHIKAHNR